MFICNYNNPLQNAETTSSDGLGREIHETNESASDNSEDQFPEDDDALFAEVDRLLREATELRRNSDNDFPREQMELIAESNHLRQRCAEFQQNKLEGRESILDWYDDGVEMHAEVDRMLQRMEEYRRNTYGDI